MVVTFIRTLIIFVTLVVVMRLMGKRQIGEMQPFEFIVTLIIADLVCIPMSDISVPLIYGIVSILCVFVLHQLMSLLEQGGNVFKLIISGKPSVVINKYGVDMYELKRNNMGVEDLIESMRTSGYFSLDDVEYAIFESNGKLSTLEKENNNKGNKSLPLLVINDGKYNKQNLEILKMSEEQIKALLKENSASLKSTEVLTIDGDGRAYFKTKREKYKILQLTLAEGLKW